MDKQIIQQTLAKLKKEAKKRNFNQSVELILNLHHFDLKKTPINDSVVLHFSHGKKAKVCALVDKELINAAKEVFDKVVSREEFSSLDKKQIKKLAREYDFFVAQANIMPDIAKFFGRALGPRGKMPNPKLGCVVPPAATNLKALYEKLQKTVKFAAKNQMIVHSLVGKEDMKDEEVIDNILTIYNAIIALLPQGTANVKSVFLKLTMSPAIEVKNGKTKDS